MRKYIFRIAMLILAVGCYWSFSCSGGDARKSTLEGNLLDYDEVNVVRFDIKGNATCQKCLDDEIPIAAMRLEIYPEGGPLDRMELKIYDNLGDFEFKEVAGYEGQTLKLDGLLWRDSDSGWITAAYGYAKFTVPDSDGDIVNIDLIFPSSDD